MRRTPIACLFVLPAAILLSGCQQLGIFASKSTGQATSSVGEWMVRKSAGDDPILMDVVGPIGIDVESFNGHVTVYVDDTLEEAQITMTRRAMHGWRRTDEAKASLDEVHYSVDVVPGELGQVLQVRTWSTHTEPYFQRCDVLIQVPEVDSLRVRGGMGNIVARDIAGPVDIIIDEGFIRVMTNRPIRQSVQVINNQGDIDFRVRGESAGDLDFEAVRGKVYHNVRYGSLTIFEGTDHDSLRASFNDGDNPIVLRAADGSVRFASITAPTHVGVHIVD